MCKSCFNCARYEVYVGYYDEIETCLDYQYAGCDATVAETCEDYKEKPQTDEAEEEEHEYRSATRGDYSPSCPWNAPGMSISDFI